MQDNTKKLLTIPELCSLLNIGRNTAYTLIKEKKLKSFKIGNTWKIPVDSVNEYIKQSISESER